MFCPKIVIPFVTLTFLFFVLCRWIAVYFGATDRYDQIPTIVSCCGVATKGNRPFGTCTNEKQIIHRIIIENNDSD